MFSMAAKRAVIRIQLDLRAKQLLDEICENRGMTQIAVLSRLVVWLTRQNNLIQTAVLGGLSEEDQAQLAQLLLKRMATGEGKPDDEGSSKSASKRPRKA
jgi:hypothetical protein